MEQSYERCSSQMSNDHCAIDILFQHRRSQGVHWVHVHPPRAEKKYLGQIYRGKL